MHLNQKGSDSGYHRSFQTYLCDIINNHYRYKQRNKNWSTVDDYNECSYDTEKLIKKGTHRLWQVVVNDLNISGIPVQTEV